MPRSNPRRIDEFIPKELREYFVYMAIEFYKNIVENGGNFNPETFPFPPNDSNLLFLLEKKDEIKIALKLDELIGELEENRDIPNLDVGFNLDKAIDKLFSSIESRLDDEGAWKSYKELKKAYDEADLSKMKTTYDRYNTGRLRLRSPNFKELHRKLGEKIDELNLSLESAWSDGDFPEFFDASEGPAAPAPAPAPAPASGWRRCLQCRGHGHAAMNKKKTKKKKHTKKRKKKNTKQKRKKHTKKRKNKNTKQKKNTKRR